MSLKIEKSASIVHAQDIGDICHPLKSLNITYFSHVKIIGNQFSAVSNNPQFAEHYLKNKYYNADLHTIDQENKLDKYILWDGMELDGLSKMMDEESLAFGLNHAFSIIDYGQTEKNYYHFATNLNSPAMNQVYLANIELLEKFISYFNNQINNSSELSRIYDNKHIFQENNNTFKLNSLIDENIKAAFLESIKLNTPAEVKTILPMLTAQKNDLIDLLASQGVRLTNREADCMLLILSGKSAKQISAYLNISSRTVEEYTANIKMKFKVKSKAALIESVIFCMS